MKTKTLCLVFLLGSLVALLLLPACQTPRAGAAPDPAQIARIGAVAEVLATTGSAAVMVKTPSARGELLAVAEAIEQAAALPDAPKPAQLISLVSASAAQFGGPYGAAAGIALQAGLGLYQSFYAANVTNALDSRPACKSVLLALARGIRAGVGPNPPAAAPATAPGLSREELILRPAPSYRGLPTLPPGR